MWINVWGQVKLCDPSLTRANLSTLEIRIARIIKRSTNVMFTLFLKHLSDTAIAGTRKSCAEVVPTTLATFSYCYRELWPVTLTFECDLDSVMVKHRVKYLGHRSVHSKTIVQTCTRWHTEQTHRCIGLLVMTITILTMIMKMANQHIQHSVSLALSLTMTFLNFVTSLLFSVLFNGLNCQWTRRTQAPTTRILNLHNLIFVHRRLVKLRSSYWDNPINWCR